MTMKASVIAVILFIIASLVTAARPPVNTDHRMPASVGHHFDGGPQTLTVNRTQRQK